MPLLVNLYWTRNSNYFSDVSGVGDELTGAQVVPMPGDPPGFGP
jgi:hypothetical protein